jgi:hypothetical protein
LEPIGTTIGVVKTAFELLKSLRGMARDFKSVDFNEKLMDLQNVLLDLQGKLSELELENETMKRQSLQTADIAARKQRMRFEHAVYWELDVAGNRDGPFCPNCYDENRIYRLNWTRMEGRYHCVHHKVDFSTSPRASSSIGTIERA